MGDLLTRFWVKVVEDPSGCWVWTGEKDKDGYGIFWLHQSHEYGRYRERAHRMSLMFYGKDPTGSVVHHVCENRVCVNPEHLELAASVRKHLEIHGRARWDRQSVIRAFQDCAQVLGRVPSAADWNPSHLKSRGQWERVSLYVQNDWPSQSTARDLFGTWKALVAAAEVGV